MYFLWFIYKNKLSSREILSNKGDKTWKMPVKSTKTMGFILK
jgi:hypothetical protein